MWLYAQVLSSYIQELVLAFGRAIDTVCILFSVLGLWFRLSETSLACATNFFFKENVSKHGLAKKIDSNSIFTSFTHQNMNR